MTSPDCQDRASDARGTPRVSMYLAGVLYSAGSSSPVKIRNMSIDGALIEGEIIPATGSVVQLARGALAAKGLVAWSAIGCCGLKFSSSVNVHQWKMPPTNTEQPRIDKVVALVRSGAVPLPLPELTSASAQRVPGEQLTDDLSRISAMLDDLANELAQDPDVLARHGRTLQNLDIAMQTLGAISALLNSGEGSDLDKSAKLDGLRKSAAQALKQGE